MYLLINTAERGILDVYLIKDRNTFQVRRVRAGVKQAEKLLPAIEKILHDNRLSSKKIKGVGAISGPGGFTSLRIGITTANTLAQAWGIPAIGLERKTDSSDAGLVAEFVSKIKTAKRRVLIKPEYGREPNIT